MLPLILPYRHQVRLVEQNVRRHQHGVSKEAGSDVVCVLLGLLLELRHAAQLTELGIAAQNPAQLRVLGHMALDEHDVLLRVQAAGDILGQLGHGTAAQFRRILADGNGMHIHDAVNAVIFILKSHPVLDRAHIRAERQFTAGLDTTENPLFPYFVFHASTPHPCILIVASLQAALPGDIPQQDPRMVHIGYVF